MYSHINFGVMFSYMIDRYRYDIIEPKKNKFTCFETWLLPEEMLWVKVEWSQIVIKDLSRKKKLSGITFFSHKDYAAGVSPL